MELLLAFLCVCLLFAIIALLHKLRSVKRNIRHFSKELDQLKDMNYSQPLKVSDFDNDITELATKINEHTYIQRKLRIEYEQSKKQLDTVISGISHDFRTPLTASLGYMQLLEKSGELSEKNAEYLYIAMQKAQYLKELSDEFFELTKLESKCGELQIEEINLSNLLTEAVLEQHSWIEQRNIHAEFDIRDGIVIQSNLHCLTRIITNLMSNAQKYSADLFGVSLNTENSHTVLRIYNTLDDSTSIDLEKVFEPFYRMDSRTAGGSGLGLYVVRCLSEKLDLKASAEIVSGNVFSVKIVI